MEFLVKLALIVCFTNFVSSSVSPFVNKLETINVLVPQNDRNLRDSVKQLQLDGEDEVLTENDILDISEILPDLDLHKTKKRNRFYNNNKVNDDQNKNNLENKIDVEPQAYFDFASLSGFSPELTTSSYTTTTVAPLNTSQNRTDPNTTEVSNGTVTKTSSSIGNSTLRQTTFTSTPNEPSSTNSTTPALIELTTTESITSKPTTKPPFDSKDYTYKLLDKECVLGTAALYLTWIHENGTLKEGNLHAYDWKKYLEIFC